MKWSFFLLAVVGDCILFKSYPRRFLALAKARDHREPDRTRCGCNGHLHTLTADESLRMRSKIASDCLLSRKPVLQIFTIVGFVPQAHDYI